MCTLSNRDDVTHVNCPADTANLYSAMATSYKMSKWYQDGSPVQHSKYDIRPQPCHVRVTSEARGVVCVRE